MVAVSNTTPVILSTVSMQAVLDRLPSEQKARIRWAPNELNKALVAFVQSEQDNVQLAALVQQVVDTFAGIIDDDLLGVIRSDEFAESVELNFEKDIDVLARHLDSTDLALARWVGKAWVGLIRSAMRDIANAPADQVQRAFAKKKEPMAFESAVHPTRVQALLMAAVEAARRDIASESIARVVRRAFDDMNNQLALLRDAGFSISVFERESDAARRTRISGYAALLRDELDDDDLRALEAARLQALR